MKPNRNSVASGPLQTRSLVGEVDPTLPRYGTDPLTLHADNLLDLSDNFDQVFLVLHHRFN